MWKFCVHDDNDDNDDDDDRVESSGIDLDENLHSLAWPYLPTKALAANDDDDGGDDQIYDNDDDNEKLITFQQRL